MCNPMLGSKNYRILPRRGMGCGLWGAIPCPPRWWTQKCMGFWRLWVMASMGYDCTMSYQYLSTPSVGSHKTSHFLAEDCDKLWLPKQENFINSSFCWMEKSRNRLHIFSYPGIHVFTYPCILVFMHPSILCIPLSMCAHILVPLYTYIPLSMYVHTLVSMYTGIPVSMYPCIHVSLYPCILVSLYPCIHVSMYPCIYVCEYSVTPYFVSIRSALS